MNNSESKKRLLELQKSKFLSEETQDALRFAIEKLSEAEYHQLSDPGTLIPEENMIVLKTTQKKLLAVLQSLLGIVERPMLPVLSNVLIRKAGNEIQFTTNNLEIQITSTAEMDGDVGNFTTTVDVRKLIDILRAMTVDQTVILESIKNKIILNGTKSKFTLGTLPSQDFILEQEASSFGPILSMSQKTLKNLLGQISFCMAKDDIRNYLNGVLLVAERRELYLVSTDGHRMAFTSTTLTNEVPNKHEVIFPRKTVLELQRLLSDAEGVIDIQFTKSQAKLRFDGIIFFTKLLEGKYPDYTNVIRRDYLYNLTLSRQALLSCLNRAAILTSRFKGVRLKFDDSTLRVVTGNFEQDEAVEELDIVYDGASIELGFNVTYIIEILTNMEQEIVRIELTDANSSVLITIPNNDLFKYVVMPMRI